MTIVLDTHSLLWFLTDNSKLSKNAEQSIDDAARILIPTIVILELLYLLKKRGLIRKFNTVLQKITKDQRYQVLPLDITVVLCMNKEFYNLEMHDGIIAASAKLLDVPLVSKDEQIQHAYKNTIW